MNHIEAVQTFAAEKYLLNELPAPLREEFEEHFFDCQECALDVRAGAAFIGQAKTELGTAHQGVSDTKSRSFFSIFVFPMGGLLVAAMAGLLVYQNLVTLPRLRSEVAAANAPAILNVTSLLGSASRGAEMPSATVSAGQPLLLNVDVPTDDRFSAYQLEVYEPAGSRAETLNVTPDQAKDTLLIRLPASTIHGGIYTVKVQGLAGSGNSPVSLAQYRFRVLNAN